MLSIEVCVGSACHVKGSYSVIGELQQLISDEKMEDNVEVKAAFCFGHCANAVSVHFESEDEEKVYSVAPDNASVRKFFNDEVMKRV